MCVCVGVCVYQSNTKSLTHRLLLKPNVTDVTVMWNQLEMFMILTSWSEFTDKKFTLKSFKSHSKQQHPFAEHYICMDALAVPSFELHMNLSEMVERHGIADVWITYFQICALNRGHLRLAASPLALPQAQLFYI